MTRQLEQSQKQQTIRNKGQEQPSNWKQNAETKSRTANQLRNRVQLMGKHHVASLEGSRVIMRAQKAKPKVRRLR